MLTEDGKVEQDKGFEECGEGHSLYINYGVWSRPH